MGGALCADAEGQVAQRPVQRPVGMAKPTLGYWSTRGMGAQVTYLLAYCGVDYNNKEYVASVGENGEWLRGTWPEDKFNLGIGFPNLPYFLDGDVKMAETMPIMRYISA